MKPLESLLDLTTPDPEFPDLLRKTYDGDLAFAKPPDRPFVYSNFVSSIDGVVSFEPSHGGSEVSGSLDVDRFVMGLLRASADAVIVGAGTVRAVSPHIWSADYIYPPFTDDYQFLRRRRGKPIEHPLTVVVSASGDLPAELAVFQTPWVRCLIVTTDAGKDRLNETNSPRRIARVRSVGDVERISAASVLDILWREFKIGSALIEGGPQLLGSFAEADLIDEMFLTIAPQISGRTTSEPRPGLVQGVAFPAERAPWVRLVSLKRSGSYLFARYRFARGEAALTDLSR